MLNAYGFEKRLLEFILHSKLTVPLVPGKCYSQVFHKGQS